MQFAELKVGDEVVQYKRGDQGQILFASPPGIVRELRCEEAPFAGQACVETDGVRLWVSVAQLSKAPAKPGADAKPDKKPGA